jgi:hypothetical protein
MVQAAAVRVSPSAVPVRFPLPQIALEGYGRAAAESAEPAPVTPSPHSCEGSLEARAVACLVPAAAVGSATLGVACFRFELQVGF